VCDFGKIIYYEAPFYRVINLIYFILIAEHDSWLHDGIDEFYTRTLCLKLARTMRVGYCRHSTRLGAGTGVITSFQLWHALPVSAAELRPDGYWSATAMETLGDSDAEAHHDDHNGNNSNNNPFA
jgi:hypothetical protein